MNKNQYFREDGTLEMGFATGNYFTDKNNDYWANNKINFMENINDKIDSINNKEDFINFLNVLIGDLRNSQDEWGNNNLESYLEAMASWTEDMDGFYLNKNLPVPKDINWKVFANILMAAKMYE